MSRFAAVCLIVAGFFGATAVGLGAWAAHGLHALAGEDAVARYQTAVSYQLWHALALLACALLHERATGRARIMLKASAAGFAAGVTLFCGSLYLAPFGYPTTLAPVGGVLLMLAWADLMVAGGLALAVKRAD